MIHKFNLLENRDGRLTVAPESEWDRLKTLPAGTVVDVGGDVFAGGYQLLHKPPAFRSGASAVFLRAQMLCGC